jgi:hypothetical protein
VVTPATQAEKINACGRWQQMCGGTNWQYAWLQLYSLAAVTCRPSLLLATIEPLKQWCRKQLHTVAVLLLQVQPAALEPVCIRSADVPSEQCFRPSLSSMQQGGDQQFKIVLRVCPT